MLRYLPYVLGGAVLGLLAVLAVVGRQPSEFDPLTEADDTPAPFVDIPAGQFLMGSSTGPEDERPVHLVQLSAFRMEQTEVTNARFAAFVKATGYITVAERQPDPNKYPDADPKLLKPGSAVFKPVASLTDPHTWDTPHPPWWKYVVGANWKNPTGPGNDLRGKMNHPVVHVAWEDATAYAKWAGRRLPTEAEFEYAARGGLKEQPYCWGSAGQGTEGKFFANTFQGRFPDGDTGADGFKGLSPVKSFPPNGYGVFDLSGNVWEWCNDWYDSRYYSSSPKLNPPGPTEGEPDPFSGQPQRVRRGGSYLCTDTYCKRYVPNARDKNPDDSGASHTGFRCVKDGL